MKSTKLFKLLSHLNGQELDLFEKFIRSPYFHSDEDVLRLFDVLHPMHPDFESPELSRKWLFSQVFPDEEFEDKRLRYVFSRLNKLGELFLAQRHFEERPEQVMLAQMEEMSRRGLEKGYRQIGRIFEDELQVEQMGSSRFFLARFQWAEIREQHFERQRIRKFDDSIQTGALELDRYYFYQRLRLACAMLDRQHILDAPYNVGVSDAWLQHLISHSHFDEPVIQLYALIFQALSEEEREDDFRKLRTGIDHLESKLPAKDLREIYLFAINYCARKIRQGNNAFLEEARSLYQSGIEKLILIEDGQLSPWAFTNMVKLSLRLGHFDQIESFITRYSQLLPKEFRENALQYNLAELYYATNRLNQAQQRLLRVAYTDLNYYLGARVMLIKIYLETDAEEPLLSLLSSFMIFLKRNKALSSTLKHTYLNFCKLLFQIIRRKPAALPQICSKINETELLTEREWLLSLCSSRMNH